MNVSVSVYVAPNFELRCVCRSRLYERKQMDMAAWTLPSLIPTSSTFSSPLYWFEIGDKRSHGILRNGNRLFNNGGGLKKGWRISQLMSDGGLQAECKTYSRLLQQQLCISTSTKSLTEGKQLHAHIIKTVIEADCILQNNLVNMYAKNGKISDARNLFEKMSERSVVSWTGMIAGYVRHGFFQEAFDLFSQMLEAGSFPNEFTYNVVLRACASLIALEKGQQVHTHILKRQFQLHAYVGGALVDMYSKCDLLNYARQVFEELPTRDVVCWTAMIAGYARNGYCETALKQFCEMQWAGIKPTEFTFSSLLATYNTSADLQQGKQLHARMLKSGFHLVVFSGSALVDMYTKCGSLGDAHRAFDDMSDLNVVSWNTVITGYSQHGYGEEALRIFRRMRRAGMESSKYSFASILRAGAILGSQEQGMQIHSQIIKVGFQSDVFVGSALLDMYAKCGNIDDACHVFDKMPERNVVSWNAMIAGYSQHGHGSKALKMFEEMQQAGIQPNHITFVGVLSACSHVGLVDEGQRYFTSMIEDHSIIPRMEHYACMIDLLGRAGCLDQAEDVIKGMPFEPGVLEWVTLLGACRVHQNIEIGKRAAEHLFELAPQFDTTYVLLSNIYADAGMKDEVVRVRKMMKARGLKKEPGCSWIEVQNKVHAFFVNERSHPQIKQVHEKLDELTVQIKKAGYVPNTNSALDDEQEQKEDHFSSHSEKLAIAFGLITISPGIPIRIMKNLRVCNDCHSTTKFISLIAAREIIVRDANRFHHFKNGICSCGDFW